MHELKMSPKPGTHSLSYVGDRLRVVLHVPEEQREHTRAFLRTNLTRGRVARREVIAMAGRRVEDALTFAGASWRDLPLERVSEGFAIDLPLLEVGHFRAKAYCADATGKQYWPEGDDLGISVHPDRFRTANTIYCAFARALSTPFAAPSRAMEGAIAELDQLGYAVIPPSGTLRSLIRALPHVFDTLGCRILHLLPVGPVPTTFARMGRFGSPYAQLDLTGIDPALVEFDKRATGVEQFCELTDAVHLRGGAVILDVVLNHTGWASRLYEEHPEWFLRKDGLFHSPGAWGNTWADLVELDQSNSALWEVLAESLLVWCKRGVDGFRCDAGYMIPLPAWQYIIARVRDAFPECVFLLEGLGGAWSATEALLSVGGMQWAYSELFQCYSPREVADYLDHANAKSDSVGVLVHYSETHDNDRLAKRGARYASMRNHLSALTSHAGAFAFTSGVEWLCDAKIDVHEARSLGFGNSSNLIASLTKLNRLLAEHPAFFDAASVARLSTRDAPVLVLSRVSADGLDQVLVLVNIDVEEPRTALLSASVWARLASHPVDLLGAQLPAPSVSADGTVMLKLGPGESLCLASQSEPRGAAGETYRRLRAQAAFAYEQLAVRIPHESIGAVGYAPLARFVESSPEAFLAAVSRLSAEAAREGLLDALSAAADAEYRPVVVLRPEHGTRTNLIPPDHWVLLRDRYPFAVGVPGHAASERLRSVPMGDEHVVAIPPHAGETEQDLVVLLDRFAEAGSALPLRLRNLARSPSVRSGARKGIVLLTNGRGGMSRVRADIGTVNSKYDAFFAANLHPDVPEDRWVLVKRLRAWVNADGFITPLDAHNLVAVEPGPPGVWLFAANAGDGRRVGVRLTLGFVQGRNTLLCKLERSAIATHDLPFDRAVRLVLRFDLEDRNFHTETRETPTLSARFEAAISVLPGARGFVFAPASNRHLEVTLSAGEFHRESEWCRAIPHPFDAERGMNGSGDAFSPGWMDLPLVRDEAVVISLDADGNYHDDGRQAKAALTPLDPHSAQDFEATLRRAARAFVAKRGQGRTVIAGYPWFLDWGRDTFVAARGLIAAGYHDDVQHMLLTYAALERNGTLPNFLAGAGEGSRESSDAPLWFSLACEELAQHRAATLYALRAADGRSLRDVLGSIAENFMLGTATGIRVDPESLLVWSPSHFTWMDTNYPPGTPREGYPIELAVMFARLLQQLANTGATRAGETCAALAARAAASFGLFYREDLGFFADTLHAPPGTPARDAHADDHLRPNQLLALSLGVATGARARSALAAVTRHLLIPGAMRSLAPLAVRTPLPITNQHGLFLNDPLHPYFGSYSGDEDTRRKPAYHNGTGWGWWLGTYAEALVRAYPGDPFALTAARSVLGSCARLLGEGCLGQLPEVMDGDAPHHERGCDAQAWSVTETLRVWLMLHSS